MKQWLANLIAALATLSLATGAGREYRTHTR